MSNTTKPKVDKEALIKDKAIKTKALSSNQIIRK